MRRIYLSALLLACAWMSIESAAAQICKWVDQDGITHYSTECPEDGSADVLDLDTGPGAEGGDATQPDIDLPEEFPPLERPENSQAEITLAPAQPSVLQDPEARADCVQATTNLVILQVEAPVFYDDNGNLYHGRSERARAYEGARTYVSDQQRDEEIIRYRNFLRDNCGRTHTEREQIADLVLAQGLQGLQEQICADKKNLLDRLRLEVTGLPSVAAEELQGYLELNCN